MKNQTVEHIKNVVPLPWAFIEYIVFLYKNSSIDKNIENKGYIISAFFMSIGFSGFLASLILDLKFDFSNSIDKVEFVLHFIYNVLPLAILYSIVLYLFVIKKNIDKKHVFSFFLQIIKFFIIANILISISMLIAVDQLMVNNVNMFKDVFEQISIQNIIVIIVSGFIYLLSIIIFIFKPTYKYLKEFYKWNKTISIVLILLVVILNNLLYSFSFYPKLETKNLVIKDKFCDDISDIKFENNLQCNKLTLEELKIIKEKCHKIIG